MQPRNTDPVTQPEPAVPAGLTSAGKPRKRRKYRKTRWTGTTPAERREALRPAHEALQRAAHDRRIDELIAEAPPLTEEQKAKLRTLLNATGEATA